MLRVKRVTARRRWDADCGRSGVETAVAAAAAAAAVAIAGGETGNLWQSEGKGKELHRPQVWNR
jgi:hypothetical protein